MQEFNYEIIHRAGKKNLDNDALSRRPIACMVTTRAKSSEKQAETSDKSKTNSDKSKDNQAQAQNPPGDTDIRKTTSVPDISRFVPDISSDTDQIRDNNKSGAVIRTSDKYEKI